MRLGVDVVLSLSISKSFNARFTAQHFTVNLFKISLEMLADDPPIHETKRLRVGALVARLFAVLEFDLADHFSLLISQTRPMPSP